MRIAFLLRNAYAVGGTIRTTINLAAPVAELHHVRLVSLVRHQAERPLEPLLEPPPGAPLTAPVDRRRSAADLTDMASPGAAPPVVHFPAGEGLTDRYHRVAEQRLIDWPATTGAEAVINARTGPNVLLARFGPPGAPHIGQERLRHAGHPHRLRRRMRRRYPHLDALVTKPRADARARRPGLRLPHGMVGATPNSGPATAQPTDGAAKTVVPAGRLTRVKRYNTFVVDAFARAGAQHPDRSQRIYGEGPEQGRLATRIGRRGLRGRGRLMGAATPLAPERATGSISAVTSALEAFGMTLVEAMRCDLPVISTGRSHGPHSRREVPHEIPRAGNDGRLNPRDDIRADIRADSGALLRLMGDRHLRTRMGAASRERVAPASAPTRATRNYDRLPTTLRARHDARPADVPRRRRNDPAPGSTALYRATGTLLARTAPRRLSTRTHMS
ncbi:glycosyltransferase [Streptomyces sp. NPDC018045]|uniref:glycosyltransferase n=1 Tax=Streptomyces sp. NPDC018045 TaxID=3365037 RepID=UPI0037AAA461